MRTLLRIASVAFFTSLGPLAAQQATPPTTPQQATPPAPADAKVVASPPAAEPTPSPVPADDSWLMGSIDVGYRWNTGVGGSFDSYRDIVNLGSGPKLLGADFTITDPKHRLFDQIHVRASDWGGDPYSTFHLDARKAKLYNFNADYRDIAYFSFSPSYADPLLARGIVLNQQSFDTHRRLGSFALDVLPGNWFIPYFGYESDSGSGSGVTTFVSNGNTYPVPNQLNDATRLYRGGVRFELRRFHATLEQGGTTFKDDQRLNQSLSPGSVNYGDVLTPVFGQTLDLTSLAASYGVHGTSINSKGLFTANPISWLDLYGQFLYSQPDSNVNYQEAAAGSLYLQSQILFYSGEQFLLAAAAKMPHTTASLGAEMRPLRRVPDHRRSVYVADGPAAQRGLGVVESTFVGRGNFSADRRGAGCIARHQLQSGRGRCPVRRDFPAHASRRLPLCMGRCERRRTSGRGLSQLGAGQAAEQCRPRLGDVPRQPETLRHRRN